ncbi:MAG: 50S ribosomal protein L17 [Clostridia bacterium]|nr:50S ribosomal protein L17 [Clostridia bacterium]
MTMRKLGRTTAQRKAMLRGMVTLLLENGKVETTYTRAQELSAKADEMITLGKKGTLAAYRDALAYITKEDVAKKVFSVIAPAYADLNGGYTQVLKMGPRRGDGAEMAIVKLVAVKAPAEEAAPAEEK